MRKTKKKATRKKAVRKKAPVANVSEMRTATKSNFLKLTGVSQSEAVIVAKTDVSYATLVKYDNFVVTGLVTKAGKNIVVREDLDTVWGLL